MPFFNTPLTSRPVFTSPLIILALTVSSIITSAAAGAGPRATGTGTTDPGSDTPAVGKAPKPLTILILGGTGFTGPFQVKYALARGHKVTVFNRGKTHPGELPEGVEQLIGDRNGQLDALKGRKWDVVIDNPTMLPKWVRDAARDSEGQCRSLRLHLDHLGLRQQHQTGLGRDRAAREIRRHRCDEGNARHA